MLSMKLRTSYRLVMPGLVPGIYVFVSTKQ
jgi:hypothetical protein